MTRHLSIFCVCLLVAAGTQPLSGQVQAAKAGDAQASQVKVDVAADKDEANLEPVEREMRNRLQPVLKKEISFAARVCHLDKADRKSLAEAEQQALNKAAHLYTASQRNNPQPQLRVFNAARNVTPSNPLKLLQTAFLEVAKEKLPAESWQNLSAQYAQRDAYHKQAMIDNLIVLLDRKLNLTHQQRADIAKSLAAEWDESWAPHLQFFIMYDQDLIPRFPDKCISPYLEPAQKSVWDNMPNKNLQFAVDAFEVDPIIGGAANDTSDDDP